MFNLDLLTPSERQEALDLCASIQKQCAELRQTLQEIKEEDEQARSNS